MAANVVALAGNAPPTSEAVGATCTDCAVLADVYQVTMRCDAFVPTPRTIAGRAWPAPARRRMVIVPMPSAAVAASAATPGADSARP